VATGQSELGTVTSCSQAEASFRHFSSKMAKAQLLKFFKKKTTEKVCFFLDYNLKTFPDIMFSCCMCDCEGLRDDSRDIIESPTLQKTKTRLENPKAFTAQ